MREQKNDQFWQARLAQAFLILLGTAVILPVIWSTFTSFIVKLFYHFTIPLSAILSAGLYMPVFATALIIGIVIGARSATWGEVTWRFMPLSVVIISTLMYYFMRAFHIFDFSDSNFWLWEIAWIFTGIIGYFLLQLSALNQRYQRAERPLLLRAFYIVIINSLYIPAIFTIFRFAMIEDKDQLAYLAGQHALALKIESASLLMAIIIAFGFVAKLRRGNYSLSFFVLWPLSVFVFFFGLQMFANDFTNVISWAVFYGTIAVLSISFCSLLLVLLSLGHETNLMACHGSTDRIKFAFMVFIILSLVSVPLWQSLTILWRATLFGLPPASFFMEQIHIAIICGTLFFALPCALYTFIKQKINFVIMFIIALFASFASSFLPAGHLGVSFGFLFDHLLWQILIFGPIAVIGWYILSRMPQIKCNLYKI